MTNENLGDLIAALSHEDEQELTPGAAEEQLREILADLAVRPVPVSSLHRLWSLGGLSGQIALAYAVRWMRQWFSDAETRQQRVLETNLRVALKLFRRLAYLRGAVIKLGQTAGSLPHVVPAEIAEIMEKLHFEAPPMHFSLVREMLANELGGEPEQIFARFDKEAFAAASLGQVHRAQLKSGEQVAVKIQYPGIARTIDADFRNLGALLFPMRLSKDWERLQSHFAEVRRMLEQEVDFAREAESLRRARELFAPEEGFVVPQVYEKYSSARVLTTEFVPGVHLREFLASNPPQALRNHFGTKIQQSYFRLYFGYMNYGDPHPGNYIFLPDGRLGLIDFGCVQHFGPEEREILRLCEHLIAGDESVLPALLRLACGVEPDDPEDKYYLDLMRRSREWMMEPMQESPFDFGDEGHLQHGYAWFSNTVAQRRVRGHSMYVYYHRCVFGLKAILYRLRAQVDVRALHAGEHAIWQRREAAQ